MVAAFFRWLGELLGITACLALALWGAFGLLLGHRLELPTYLWVFGMLALAGILLAGSYRRRRIDHPGPSALAGLSVTLIGIATLYILWPYAENYAAAPRTITEAKQAPAALTTRPIFGLPRKTDPEIPVAKRFVEPAAAPLAVARSAVPLGIEALARWDEMKTIADSCPDCAAVIPASLNY